MSFPPASLFLHLLTHARRSVANSTGIDFARQLAERDASLNPTAAKKFRSSAAPKGTKLGSGYQDRTQLRTSTEEDEKASRVKALEEMVKLGQMERATFEALRDEIIGGDVKDAHLVKGLDWKLLDRVRKGEDVLSSTGASPKPTVEPPPAANPEEVDEEFEKFAERDVQPTAKQETIKKGEMAPPPPPIAGKKRTRDEILKELKASRQAAAAEKAEQVRQSALSSKFRKIGEKKATSRMEKDDRGRDVLITVDGDGNVKRKVKKARIEPSNDNRDLLMPDKDAKPLGLDVTLPAPQEAEPIQQDDGDIFEGIAGEYDPLGGALDGSESSDTDSEHETKGASPPATKAPPTNSDERAGAMPLPKQTSGARNYFNEPAPSTDPSSEPPNNANPMQDPTILAALKKASTLDPLSSAQEGDTSEEAAKAARRKRMLEAHDRDAEDMDLGFGSSRFEDEADDGEGEKRVKLSVWGSKEGGGEEGKGGEGKGKRKRGPKKRKGDKDSAADVLKVMERRKGEGKS
ncbi:MAG: hypothetical protein LQ350_002377 [Teloschistes chrysophthalmus]|nr:MAG: hypothetical protein LQ350_002377 [Niorma chrysophthalma]